MQALMIAGTAMQAVGTIASGQQAASIGARNADVLNEQAHQTDIATAGRERLLRERNREALSQQRTAMLQNGLDPASGSALFTNSQSMRDADLDALQLRYEGLLQSRSERMAADQERWKGKAAKRQALFSAAGQIVHGAGNYLGMTGAPMVGGFDLSHTTRGSGD